MARSDARGEPLENDCNDALLAGGEWRGLALAVAAWEGCGCENRSVG